MINTQWKIHYFCAAVLYPYKEGATCDFEHYSKNVIPEYVEILGDNCVKFKVCKRLSTPGVPNSSFVCCANVWIKNPQKSGAAMSDPRMNELMAKISSFTEIQPIRQFERVIY
ncbi:hypothetical protein BXY57_0362 [Thermoflavifilum aggregans]|uniref:Uncharacterized protein n=1 Tax=Thermoflavifilum aggregans TaxID=454188 RepID=A0A2M9CS85_9BACT|nr:EthD family reductase [Thermoflavifilum aggregans]PJJ74800.1 hypothetical protein BXY57_0362 [Thermoflavifilum aggregans]